MTERARRLQRLVSLREQEHSVAAMGLRVANATLQAHDLQMQSSQNEHDHARQQSQTALVAGRAEQWHLACAEMALAQHAIACGMQARAQLAAAAQTAAVLEADGRREQKKMERVFDYVRQADKAEAMRAEQRTLDEMALLLRPRLSTE